MLQKDTNIQSYSNFLTWIEKSLYQIALPADSIDMCEKFQFVCIAVSGTVDCGQTALCKNTTSINNQKDGVSASTAASRRLLKETKNILSVSLDAAAMRRIRSQLNPLRRYGCLCHDVLGGRVCLEARIY